MRAANDRTTGSKSTALITGASRGIGYELARQFAQHGHAVVLVASNKPRLCDVADELRGEYNAAVQVLVKDLALPAAAKEIYDELQQQRTQIDVVVNNAGFNVYGPHCHTDGDAEQRMLAVNVIALTQLTKLFVKDMVGRNSGTILNVGSVSSFSPFPLESVYAATKAYVLSYSESLAAELRGTGVKVLVLCPGITSTDFYHRAGMTLDRVSSLFKMDALPVAQAGYAGLTKSRMVILPGLVNKIIAHYPKWAPIRYVLRINEHFLGSMAREETKLVRAHQQNHTHDGSHQSKPA